MKTPVTRNSHPIGLPGWRRVTSQPTAAQGTPITAAITPLSSCCDSRLSGTAAAKDNTASTPSALAQTFGEPRCKRRVVASNAAIRSATGSSPPASLTNRTLRTDRSGNVTALAGGLAFLDLEDEVSYGREG